MKKTLIFSPKAAATEGKRKRGRRRQGAGEVGDERVVRSGDGTRRVAISPHLQADDGEAVRPEKRLHGGGDGRGKGGLGFRSAKTCMVPRFFYFFVLSFFLFKVLHLPGRLFSSETQRSHARTRVELPMPTRCRPRCSTVTVPSTRTTFPHPMHHRQGWPRDRSGKPG